MERSLPFDKRTTIIPSGSSGGSGAPEAQAVLEGHQALWASFGGSPGSIGSHPNQGQKFSRAFTKSIL